MDYEELRQKVVFESYSRAFSNFLSGVNIRLTDRFQKDYKLKAIVFTIYDIFLESELTLLQFTAKEADYIFELVLDNIDKLNEYEDSL